MRILVLISIISLSVFLNCTSTYAQARKQFSGDPEKFGAELKTFMGPNLNSEQQILLNGFVSVWDSTFLNQQFKNSIIELSNNMVSKRMRPNPHFTDLLTTLKAFIDYDVSDRHLKVWLEGLIAMTTDPTVQVAKVSTFIKTSGLLITEGVIYWSPSVKWTITTDRFSFVIDSVFRIDIPETDLICLRQKDSTTIYSTSGTFVPGSNTWYGSGGKVTWENVGLDPAKVYANPGKYSFSTTSASYEIDSVMFIHDLYFDSPVMGQLADRAVTNTSAASAQFPKFNTYQKKFEIKNLYDGVDFEGGLTFEGASVQGSGDNYRRAVLKMYRNDTLYVKVQSINFLFNKESIKSQSTSFTLFMDQDSLYHSDIAFSYNAPLREVNTFRSRFPTSQSPYFSSYHNMDMYFEYLTWKMDESKVTLSRARGAAMGQAYFESASFFNINEFYRLMALDDNHPLNRVSQFADYWYSETFPINEFAAWMKQSQEAATGLCIELANNGFLYYDRANGEVTIKQKLYDYINSFAKRQDYDVMSIMSQTQAPLDNAVLDMRSYRMRINGVPRIFLSDSQNVAIYPYDKSIILEKNRRFEFNGVVQAGMINVFGHNFVFSYDTFKIALTNVDSIMLAVETDQRDEYGGILARQVEDLIQMTNADLLIDEPDNKSGRKSLQQYPIFTSNDVSYIFYDRIPGLEGVYPKGEYYFKLEPFTFENTDRLTEEDLNLRGEFTAGKIMPPMNQTLTLQNDKSLGFLYEIPEGGQEIYNGKGVVHNTMTMSNEGLKGHGVLNHLSSTVYSQDINLYPDSVLVKTESMIIAATTVFPEVETSEANIRWYPWDDKLYVQPVKNERFKMFNNGTSLDGGLILTSGGLTGEGVINMPDSRISASAFNFGEKSIQADSAEYNLKSVSGDGLAFIAEDANTFIDFENQLSRFRLNSASSIVKFPEVEYICTMTDFEYDMDDKILSMSLKGREESTLMPSSELIKQDLANLEEPTFFSTNMRNDTLSFSASTGKYLLKEEKLIAENVNYLKVADALIQPDKGILGINKGARFDPLSESIIAINNKHIIHSASVNIIRSTRYTASGVYDYLDEKDEIQNIRFEEILVDSLKSKGTGHIRQIDKFMLSPNFSFLGDVHLKSDSKNLFFLGSSAITHDCETIGSSPMRFESEIDPLNVMIPVSDKPRDINGTLVSNGTFITIDSTHIYSAFLSKSKSWSDIPLIPVMGWLIYDKGAGKYRIASKEKLANTLLAGNMATFDRINCDIYSEGSVDLGLDYGLVDIKSSGDVTHFTDSGIVRINAMIALDFHFSQPGLDLMANEIRYVPTLTQVDVATDRYNMNLQNLIGDMAAKTLKEEIDLFGSSRSFPKGKEPELLLNDLTLVWNDEFRSYRSEGKIGIGFIGLQAINLKVDGFVELQKRRSGDILDIYLKVDDATWYWFSYSRGVMMTLSGNNQFNTLIRDEKLNDRKHPGNSVRTPYTYMIGVQERFESFLRRISGVEDPIEDNF